MSAFIVHGGTTLSGTYPVCGNKNEALPAVAAALLSEGTSHLTNVPDIGDIRNMLLIAARLGAHVGPLKKSAVTISAPSITTSELPPDLAPTIRGSILFASSLLVRTGKAQIVQPGGDSIGQRRIDTHFLALQALGARLTVTHRTTNRRGTVYTLRAPHGLIGAEIYLDEASVTATENALIAAAGARGTSRIVNAACEPHVQGLCEMLAAMGVRIEGVGSNVLQVTGCVDHKPVSHALGCDYIEAGSIIGLAAATNSRITISKVNPRDMRMILFQYSRLGVQAHCDQRRGSITIRAGQKLLIRTDLGGAIPKIDDNPWPAFPSDLMSIMVVTATQCRGTCIIHEKMFESRLFFIDKLIDMGAQIVLCDPHRAVIVGPAPLYGRRMNSPDIRAGMALLIAALAARGTSVIQNIEQIDRGYEQIDARLRLLGARIERLDERRSSTG